MTLPRTSILALAVIASTFSLTFASPRVGAQSCNKAADNSANNKNQPTTADKQSNAQADRETTAKIRRAILADKGLSMYAHNVKIITMNGAVTLKGPVKSDDEKNQVATDAAGVVASGAITNQLTVKQ